jgi:dihydroorotate dehydrogenase
MIGIVYRHILKPILFRFPADDVHELFLHIGNFLGRFSIIRALNRILFVFKDPVLEHDVTGMHFQNPVGLAAGFDYDADLVAVAPSIGFGFSTVGTLTRESYAGNPKPMLGRLPKSLSLLVNKGFKNRGVTTVLKKASTQAKSAPLGVSIGATNKTFHSLDELIEDISLSFEHAQSLGFVDFFELNISCPNLINVESLPEKPETPNGFKKILERIETLHIEQPVFVKMHNEKSVAETLALVEIATAYSCVTGFIFANLVKDRANKAFDPEEIARAGKGNFSGKPTSQNSTLLITEVYKKFKNRFTIIGCGGIFTGADAYEKIRAGASLVQLVSGMIFLRSIPDWHYQQRTCAAP